MLFGYATFQSGRFGLSRFGLAVSVWGPFGLGRFGLRAIISAFNYFCSP